MEREQFRVEAGNTDWVTTDGPPAQPVLHLQYEGPTDRLRPELASRMRADLAGADLDVAFRISDAGDDGDAGVLAVSDRVTGSYLLECDAPAESIRAVVRAGMAYADRTDNQPAYTLRLHTATDEIISPDLGLLLVYGPDGTLRRDTSLIPGEIEL